MDSQGFGSCPSSLQGGNQFARWKAINPGSSCFECLQSSYKQTKNNELKQILKGGGGGKLKTQDTFTDIIPEAEVSLTKCLALRFMSILEKKTLLWLWNNEYRGQPSTSRSRPPLTAI